ncbi:hypothetical protein GF377_06320 [candidate division GN15 bacterium]|nr:hypothetical protein [candidate division GN15 bacterium]
MSQSPPQPTERELEPEIRAFINVFDQFKADVDEMVAEMDRDAFNRRPDETSWSVAECIDHLSRTAEVGVGKLDEAIEKGQRRGTTGSGPFRYGWLSRWLVRQASEYPPKLKAKAPKNMRPRTNLDIDKAVAEFKRWQEEYIARVKAANGLDLRRVKAVSAVTKLVRMPLGAFFQFYAGHQRRHMLQAKDIRKRLS